MKKCLFCGEINPDATAVCPWCGRRESDFEHAKLLPFIRLPRGHDDILIRHEWQPRLDLWVCVVEDAPDTVRYVTRGDLERWGLSEQEVWRITYANLSNIATFKAIAVTQVSPDELNPAICACLSDDYIPSRLLDNDFRIALCERLHTFSCLVGVPNRNILIAFVINAEVVRETLAKIRFDFANRDHPLTDKPFLIDARGTLELVDSEDRLSSILRTQQ